MKSAFGVFMRKIKKKIVLSMLCAFSLMSAFVFSSCVPPPHHNGDTYNYYENKSGKYHRGKGYHPPRSHYHPSRQYRERINHRNK